MNNPYQLLQVESRGKTLVAVLLTSRAVGDSVREKLRHDFALLAAQRPDCVELDLRAVEYADGALTSQLIQFWKKLKDREARLVVIPTEMLAEIFEITKLDRLFEVVDVPRIVG